MPLREAAEVTFAPPMTLLPPAAPLPGEFVERRARVAAGDEHEELSDTGVRREPGEGPLDPTDRGRVEVEGCCPEVDGAHAVSATGAVFRRRTSSLLSAFT